MRKLATDEVDTWMAPASVKRPLGTALEAERVALNYYELAPGEAFGFGYHRHPDQEELFYVLDGTATFETEAGETEVGAGEAVRFAPGEWQRGTNEGDEDVRALAIGAPADADDAEIRRDCPTCGERTGASVEPTDDRGALLTVCVECGTETGRFD
jgi:uncharacterized cupin superfamily protein